MNASRRLLFVVLIGVFVLSMGVSYLDEDAFISFRVVDNFVHGYGLRWNIDERVQVYTNPLWVLALIPLHAMFGNIAPASWLLSAAVSTAAVGVVARRLTTQPVLLLSVFLPALLFSQSFTDYTNSGLENPLVYLWAALFAERWMRPGPPAWRALCTFAALSAVTRLDSFLLFAPALAWLWVRDVRRAPYRDILLGAAPLFTWLAFSLFYYGDVFPNPKYAKLNGGIPQARYLFKGLVYFADIARNDVVTCVGLVGALGAVVSRRLDARATLLLAGSVVYGLYVIWVGGDFMAGRYWSYPFFFAVVTFALAAAERGRDPSRLAMLGGFLLFFRFGLQPIVEEKDTIESREQGRFAIVRNGGIRLQRFNCGFYEALIGARGPLTAHAWSIAGLDQRARSEFALAENPDRRDVVVDGNVGKTAYFAGPKATYIDRLGIADPLIARLPDADGKMILVGHLERDVPAGYEEARATDSLDRLDPRLRAWYEAERLVIAGPLFDAERLATLVRLNLGMYDGELDAYVAEVLAARGR